MARGRTAHDETENNSDRSNSGLLLPRRSYLALAGITAGALSGVSTAAATDPDSTYERVVDVTDAGADPSGAKPIDDVLDAHVDDDTLVRFPEGEYRITGQTFDELHNVAFVGQDATLVPDDGSTELLTFTSAHDLVVDGLSADVTASDARATLSVNVTGGRNVVRGYTVTGRQDDAAPVEVSVGSGARLDVVGVELTDGGAAAGIAVGSTESADGDGTLVVEDCTVEAWTDGLAVSGHSGPLRVRGGQFADNSRAQVRVRGDDVDDARRALSVVAGEGDLVNYTFSVDGQIGHAGDEYVTDNIYGKTVEGAVSGSVDSYAFTGAVTDFRCDGDATVRVGDVGGDVADVGGRRAGSPAADEPSTSAIEGTSDGVDSFYFDGEVTELRLDGTGVIALR
jgi:hypothetical protein